MSGAGGRARQASVVDDVGCVCLREGGGAALGIPQERWRCKQGECCDRRRYGFGVLSALPWAVREDGHVMPAELSVR